MKPCPLCYANHSHAEREVNSYPLVRCSQCQFVYADIPIETIDEFNSSFDEKIAEKYNQMQSLTDELWFAGIANRFTTKIGIGKVLDIGCGNGKLLQQFKALGWDCYGVDLSPWTEKFAQEYGFQFWLGKIEDFQEGEGGFDLVVSSSTLEHIADPIQFLRETARFLKKGGMAYFCGMPNYNSASRLLEFATFSHNNPPWHVSFFTPRTARFTIAKTEIEWSRTQVKTYGIPELHILYNWLIKLKRKKGANNTTAIKQNKSPSPLNRMMIKSILWLHFYIGRFLNLGDKVEILLIK